MRWFLIAWKSSVELPCIVLEVFPSGLLVDGGDCRAEIR